MAKQKDYLDGIMEVAAQMQDDATKDISKSDVVTSASSDSDMPKMGIPKKGMPKTAMPKTDIPETAIPKTSIPKMGMPKMATPKAVVEAPENAWFKAANWLFDGLPDYISGSQWIVYLFLYRLTVGFNRDQCRIGYGALANMSGLSRNTVRRAMADLKELGLIYELDTNADGTALMLMIPAEVVHSPMPKMAIPKKGTPKMAIPKTYPSGVSEMGIPKKDTPSNAQLEASVPKMGIPKIGTNKDSSILDTNRQLVSKLGFAISDVEWDKLVAADVNLSETRLRECALYVDRLGDKARDPNAVFYAALRDNYDVGPRIRQAVAETAAVREAEEREARLVEEEAEWLASEKARLGPDSMAKIRAQAIEECEDHWLYQMAKTEEGKEGIVEAKITEILLKNRE